MINKMRYFSIWHAQLDHCNFTMFLGHSWMINFGMVFLFCLVSWQSSRFWLSKLFFCFYRGQKDFLSCYIFFLRYPLSFGTSMHPLIIITYFAAKISSFLFFSWKACRSTAVLSYLDTAGNYTVIIKVHFYKFISLTVDDFGFTATSSLGILSEVPTDDGATTWLCGLADILPIFVDYFWPSKLFCFIFYQSMAGWTPLFPVAINARLPTSRS